jgi:hypothetical protein
VSVFQGEGRFTGGLMGSQTPVRGISIGRHALAVILGAALLALIPGL